MIHSKPHGIPWGFSYTGSAQAARIRYAAQEGSSAARDTENRGMIPGFSMPFCYEALSAVLRAVYVR